jgi:hypothetical protein
MYSFVSTKYNSFYHAYSQINYNIILTLPRAIYLRNKIFTREEITKTDTVIYLFSKVIYLKETGIYYKHLSHA